MKILPAVATAQSRRSDKAAAIAEYQLQLAREIAKRAKLDDEPAIIAALVQSISTNFAAYTS